MSKQKFTEEEKAEIEKTRKENRDKKPESTRIRKIKSNKQCKKNNEK